MRPALAIGLLLCGWLTGCLIDDTSGTRGRADAPSASVPDSGSPARRESAAETLDKPSSDEAGGTLEIEGRVNE